MNTMALHINHNLDVFYHIGGQIRSSYTSIFEQEEKRNVAEVLDSNAFVWNAFTINNNLGKARVVAFYSKTDETGFLGWYECEKHLELSNEILSLAVNWLRENGVQKIIGPVNGTTWNSYRFNLDSEAPLFPGDPYQPKYFIEYWESFGFREKLLYETGKPEIKDFISTTRQQLQSEMDELELKIMGFPMNPDDEFLKKLHLFFEDSFKKSNLFSNISFDQFKSATMNASKILEPKCSFVLMDNKNEIAAVYTCFTDVYHGLFKNQVIDHQEYEHKKLFIKTLATKKEWRNNWISPRMANMIITLAYENGYEEVVYSLMQSRNPTAIYARRLYNTYKKIRTYALYELNL